MRCFRTALTLGDRSSDALLAFRLDSAAQLFSNRSHGGRMLDAMGKGSSEGYNFSLGQVRDLSANVVRTAPDTWRVSLGPFEKTYPDRDAAMAYVEFEIRQTMEQVIADWLRYCNERAKQRVSLVNAAEVIVHVAERHGKRVIFELL